MNKPNQKMSLPAVPTFDLPAPQGEFHGPKEMRVKGKRFLCDADPSKPTAKCVNVKIKGYVTYAYDCKTDLRREGMTAEEVDKLIEEDQSRCERAKFYIGDTPDTPPEKSIWVVDVPRPYTKRELDPQKGEFRKKESRTDPLKCDHDPKDIKKSPCPPYRVGDQIEIEGEWRLTSYHNERNSDGLLVYRTMKNITAEWEPPPPVPVDPTKAPAGGPAKLSPQDIVKKTGKSG
ncbi:MAG: hypothetical protein KF773_37220 [Deltaproteobacteria bacterium]|nr:hypothetical protein [Deltaproteobacteria bacterium]MCW5802928.1 hypothetical protein [Deltaproteobacteria bacterium]